MNIDRLKPLLKNVINPQPDETVLLLTDRPKPDMPIEKWGERQEMVREWRKALEEMGAKVRGVLEYEATYQNNSSLPEKGRLDGVVDEVDIQKELGGAQIYIAMTSFSATRPLFGRSRKDLKARVVSMGKVNREMEGAMLADYEKIGRDARVLAEKMKNANGAEVTFSTGHKLYVDLRSRPVHQDIGRCHRAGEGINFPGGEVWKPPYEGEDEQLGKSNTYGELPIYDAASKETVVCRLENNRVVDVLGSEQVAHELRKRFAEIENSNNLAEFAGGLNENARSGDDVPPLEREKARGFHLGLGASAHLGGNVDSNIHQDYIYTATTAVKPASVLLVYGDGAKEEIMKNGRYTIF